MLLYLAGMPTPGDLKSGDSLFIAPPLRQIDPAPNGNNLGHHKLYEVLHEVHTIKIRNHHFVAKDNLCE